MWTRLSPVCRHCALQSERTMPTRSRSTLKKLPQRRKGKRSWKRTGDFAADWQWNAPAPQNRLRPKSLCYMLRSPSHAPQDAPALLMILRIRHTSLLLQLCPHHTNTSAGGRVSVLVPGGDQVLKNGAKTANTTPGTTHAPQCWGEPANAASVSVRRLHVKLNSNTVWAGPAVHTWMELRVNVNLTACCLAKSG
jgi:hypothetical protein